ncbi:hypothetical protein KFK09_028887 [Dendrobium nobile]|uniref:Uncharacterized protein n=1 Tax=Dendrobium nobile TaxID=94219 RepID=A0A8T3A3X3_DENNO|nr:hypothetical protein KFK09_028887 [Dendrobium nobile]
MRAISDLGFWGGEMEEEGSRTRTFYCSKVESDVVSIAGDTVEAAPPLEKSLYSRRRRRPRATSKAAFSFFSPAIFILQSIFSCKGSLP